MMMAHFSGSRARREKLARTYLYIYINSIHDSDHYAFNRFEKLYLLLS